MHIKRRLNFLAHGIGPGFGAKDAKEKNAGLAAQKEDLTGKQIRLNAKLDELTTENRFLSLGSNLKYLLLLVGT